MGITICYAKCEPCQFGDHFDPPEPHRWAGQDDIEHAANTGQPEPTGNCGCWCATPSVPDENDLVVPISDLTEPGDLYAALMGGLVVDLRPAAIPTPTTPAVPETQETQS